MGGEEGMKMDRLKWFVLYSMATNFALISFVGFRLGAGNDHGFACIVFLVVVFWLCFGVKVENTVLEVRR